MKRPFSLLMLCAGVLSGCSKKEAPTAGESQLTPEQLAQIEAQYILPTNEPAAAAPNLLNPAPGQPQPAQRVTVAQQTIQQRLQGAVHAQLTMQLRMFIEKNGRVPESFSEFVNSTMDSVPPAPDGMKFVIDPTDRTVKAIKK